MHNYPNGVDQSHPTLAGRETPVERHDARDCSEWLWAAFPRPRVSDVARCACGCYFEWTDCLGPNAPDGAEGWRWIGEREDLEDEQLARLAEE